MKRVLLAAAVVVILVFANIGFAVALSPVASLNLGINGGSLRAAISGNYAYAVGGANFQVYDLSNPLAPALLYSGIAGDGKDVVAFGRYAFTADPGILNIIDVGNPLAPVVVGTLYLHTTFYSYYSPLAISAHYLFYGSFQAVKVIDFSTITAPVVVGSLVLPGNPVGIAISGNYAFITLDSSALAVVDITHPAAPILVTTVALGSYPAYGVAVQGSFAYVTTHGYQCDAGGDCVNTSGILYVLDITNPNCPKVLSSTGTPRAAEDIAVNGQYAYIVEQSTDFYFGDWGFLEMNISNPAAPQGVAEYAANGESGAQGLAIIGNYVFQPIQGGAHVFARPDQAPICTP